MSEVDWFAKELLSQYSEEDALIKFLDEFSDVDEDSLLWLWDNEIIPLYKKSNIKKIQTGGTMVGMLPPNSKYRGKVYEI